MERKVAPGYRPYGEQGEKLIDPTDCPGGHAFRWGQRSWEPCATHRGHPSWVCACGVEQYLREDGAMVEQLECQQPRPTR